MNMNTTTVNDATVTDTSTVTVTVPAPGRRRGRPVDPNSGLARARALFASIPAGTSRGDVISQFQTLGLSKDTASAYYSVINRKS